MLWQGMAIKEEVTHGQYLNEPKVCPKATVAEKDWSKP